MIGLLHVLARADPRSPSLHSQRVEYESPPQRLRCFECLSPRWRTGALEAEPERVGETSVWFRTRDTAYLLEQLPAPAPEGLEDDARAGP